MKQKSWYRALIICCAFLLWSSFALAQTPRQSSNPKALKKYNEALLALEDNRSADGIALLANVLQIDSNFIDAYLSLAGAYGNVKQYKKAVIVYERARLKDSMYFTPYLLPYSINLAGLGHLLQLVFEIAGLFLQPGNCRLGLRGVREKCGRDLRHHRTSTVNCKAFLNCWGGNQAERPRTATSYVQAPPLASILSRWFVLSTTA